jgi:hypothetical protein
MADTGQVQRYQLSANDMIKVSKEGATPVLSIGNYQFSLPSDRSGLDHFVDQWTSCTSQIQQLATGGTTFKGSNQ